MLPISNILLSNKHISDDSFLQINSQHINTEKGWKHRTVNFETMPRVTFSVLPAFLINIITHIRDKGGH